MNRTHPSISSRPNGSRRVRRFCGAAMIETVLVIPFFLIIFMLLFFAGQAFVRMHQGVAVNRYDTWRAADQAPGPSDTAALAAGSSEMMRYGPDLTRSTVRDFPDYVHELHQNAVGAYDPSAADFAEAVMNDLPSGQREHLIATYPGGRIVGGLDRLFPSNTGSPRFNRPITSIHLRLDHPWPHAPRIRWYDSGDGFLMKYRPTTQPTVDLLDTVRDERLTDLADRLQALADQGNGLADRINFTIGRIAPYRGPEFPAP